MRDYVNEHFKANPKNDNNHLFPTFECADGMRYSIQASRGHYCTPKEDGAERYSSVEVYGRKSNGDRITLNPEGWVAVSTMNKRIHRHGGPKQ